MDRSEFHKLFKCVGPAVLPVIHVLDLEQTRRNVRVALQEGAPGVLLINHDFAVGLLLPIIKQVRTEFPWLWMGVNFLGVTGELLVACLDHSRLIPLHQELEGIHYSFNTSSYQQTKWLWVPNDLVVVRVGFRFG